MKKICGLIRCAVHGYSDEDLPCDKIKIERQRVKVFCGRDYKRDKAREEELADNYPSYN